jgi:hypothetical protein
MYVLVYVNIQIIHRKHPHPTNQTYMFVHTNMFVLLLQNTRDLLRDRQAFRQLRHLLIFPTFIPLSGASTTYFHHVVIKIRQLLHAACLTSTFLDTGMNANDCKCSRDQKLNVLSEARRNSRYQFMVTYTMTDLYERCFHELPRSST